MPESAEVLPGREDVLAVASRHYVNQHEMQEPFPAGIQLGLFGLGCFWGAERQFWQRDGAYSTQVGYAGGSTPNPNYQEVCSGFTGHNEVVRVAFDPEIVSYAQLLVLFWESHDPTQGMQQGNDVGTQYRSGIYTYNEEQRQQAEASRTAFQQALDASDKATITTEIVDAPAFYYAEDYHQQYLAKNPGGYCGLGGIGVDYPEA